MVDYTSRKAPNKTSGKTSDEVSNETVSKATKKVEIKVKYFAALRESANCSEENLLTGASTPNELYSELQKRHGFFLNSNQLKVAINNRYESMDYQFQDGESIVFIPPVAGG